MKTLALFLGLLLVLGVSGEYDRSYGYKKNPYQRYKENEHYQGDDRGSQSYKGKGYGSVSDQYHKDYDADRQRGYEKDLYGQDHGSSDLHNIGKEDTEKVTTIKEDNNTVIKEFTRKGHLNDLHGSYDQEKHGGEDYHEIGHQGGNVEGSGHKEYDYKDKARGKYGEEHEDEYLGKGYGERGIEKQKVKYDHGKYGKKYDDWDFGHGKGYGYGDLDFGYGRGYGDLDFGYGRGYGDLDFGYGRGYGDLDFGYGRGYGDLGFGYGRGYGDRGFGYGRGYGDLDFGYGKGYGRDYYPRYGKGYGYDDFDFGYGRRGYGKDYYPKYGKGYDRDYKYGKGSYYPSFGGYPYLDDGFRFGGPLGF